MSLSLSSSVTYLPILVGIYLFIDLLMEDATPASLAMNLFFWLYWFVYSVAAEVALYLLQTAGSALNGGKPVPPPLLTLLSVVATATVLQSLSFKVGRYRILDLSRYLDDYRRKVLSSSGNLKLKYERRQVLRLAGQLLVKVNYKPGEVASENQMKSLYAEVLLSGANASKIRQEIEKTEQLCLSTGVPFGKIVAQRIATADPERVRSLLKE